MICDQSAWSGDGDLTLRVVERLRGLDGIAEVRVEDAEASRSEADYHFISNEVFVGFARRSRLVRTTRFGFLPRSRTVFEPVMTLADLAQWLAADAGIGTPDYADTGMLQYLRAERVVPPYQTRGFKSVELVRVYEMPARPAG